MLVFRRSLHQKVECSSSFFCVSYRRYGEDREGREDDENEALLISVGNRSFFTPSRGFSGQRKHRSTDVLIRPKTGVRLEKMGVRIAKGIVYATAPSIDIYLDQATKGVRTENGAVRVANRGASASAPLETPYT